MSFLQHNQTVLFQGDSVTDAGRTFTNPNGLGFGYPAIISETFHYKYPNLHVSFINRGISGNRVRDLVERWDADCISLSPDIVTILVGINDTWRRFDSNDPTSAKRFEDEYRMILLNTLQSTKAKVILMSPFLLPINAERMTWREDVHEKIQVTENLANEFRLPYIPLHSIFDDLAENSNEPVSYWAGDGVHPTYAGHDIIANELLKMFIPE